MRSIAQIGQGLPRRIVRRHEVGGWFDDLVDGARSLLGANQQQPAPAPMPYPYPPPQQPQDNTALYVGGAAVLVVLILVMTKK